MSEVMQPVHDLQKQLADAKQKAIDTLMKRRDAIDEQLKELGVGKRGRPTK